MRKLFLLSMLFSFAVVLQAQSLMIDNMDSSAVKAKYTKSIEGSKSRIDFTDNHTDLKEGTGSFKVNYVIGEYQKWGSYANAIYKIAETASPMDWNTYDTVSVWYKVLRAPTNPSKMVFRMHVGDRPTTDAKVEEFIYENATMLSNVTTGWVNLKIPLYERKQNSGGDLVPNTEGFTLFPTTWGGGNYNNRQLDYTSIVQFNLSAVVSGWDPNANLPADSVEVQFDKLELIGSRAIPFIIFNGKSLTSSITNTWSWGQSSVTVDQSTGPIEGKNSIKWVQGDEWSNGWSGIGWDISPIFNMGGVWQKDSLKFMMKAEAGVGDLRAQFESSNGKNGKIFTPIADNQWHQYTIALKDMTFHDGAPAIDSTKVNKFGFMANGTAKAGKVIYISDLWTGSPVLDVVAPKAPTEFTITPSTYSNVISWKDVPLENKEKYSLYFSTAPITNVTAAGVDVVKLNVEENTQVVDHILISPATNKSVSYYYAISCTDEAGNISQLAATTSAASNTAKGVSVISLSKPVNFVANGNLSEWTAANIKPFRMFPSEGTSIAPNFKVDNDADLSVLAYVAIDKDYLYVAFDVTDDIVNPSSQSDSYKNDSPDMFIGLYDWHGAFHTELKRGTTPDYHLRFNKKSLRNEGGSGDIDSLLTPGANYYWEEKFPSGYVIESRIPLTDLATKRNNSGGKTDQIYVKEGFRIPIDFAINDNDATGDREGLLTYSSENQDRSWKSPEYWSYTWIGEKSEPITSAEEANVPTEFSLLQNYPNPFNPTTQIKYSIAKAGVVTLKVYDVLGRQVADLVNRYQDAGKYTVDFNASRLASGVYVYRIESGSFTSIKKMMLMK